jgi:undecaprenyl diphosphate synthase
MPTAIASPMPQGAAMQGRGYWRSLVSALRPARIAANEAVPVHVAIIMDGNGRWAKNRGMPRTFGHRKGADALSSLIEHAARRGIRHLTVYAFSTENWQRPRAEVDELMNLLSEYLDSEAERLKREGVRLSIIGQRSRLPEATQQKLAALEVATRSNAAIHVQVALSYGGRQEIVDAARALAVKAKHGEITPDSIDEAAFAACLYSPATPDPDLLIRTGGDCRISNFLLWQASYAELYFTDTLWPDFDARELDKAIDAYQSRKRRFGRVDEAA